MSLETENAAFNALKIRPLPLFIRVLPWFLGLLMLGVYGLTLNHWISADSIGQVARLQGLTWVPTVAAPVTFLLTYPFGWLPAAQIPLAVNVFTAVCAALSLALLARSVILLPHATRKEWEPWQPVPRAAELLDARAAWLPPLLAVLVGGLQLSFWQHAIADTGEMVNLLLFAYVIRCLLEFNATQRDSWLLRGAFAYGLAMANDWTMAVFFPVLLLGLVWVKRLFIFSEFFLKHLFLRPKSFKLGLLWQIPGCWLAGLLFLALLPAVASLSPAADVHFWLALKYTVAGYKTQLFHFPRPLLLVSAAIFVMPVVLAGMRAWQPAASFNQLDFLMGPVFFQAVHGFFLLVCLWTMFDSPLSPRHLAPHLASLPLYFLGALSIGYFAGHFLAASEVRPGAPEPRYAPLESRHRQIRSVVRVFSWSALPLLGLLTIVVPLALAYKNLPVIALKRADACSGYILQLEQSLPAQGAIVLANDPFRVVFLEAALIRSGRSADFLLIAAPSLTESPGYVDFLKRKNHRFNLGLPSVIPPTATGDQILLAILKGLFTTHAIYYLPPAPLNSTLGEYFFARPAHLLDRLDLFRTEKEFADPAPPDLLRDNEMYWQTFEKEQMPEIVRQINPPRPRTNRTLSQRFLDTLRFWPETDLAAEKAGSYYAAALNDWGVELQKAGNFRAAGPCFAGALQLCPLNSAAQINFAFNSNYLASGQAAAAVPVSQYGDWRGVLLYGSVDDPNFCSILGAFLADQNLLRPALAQFERVRELAPARADTYVALARLYVKNGDYAGALGAADELLAVSPNNQDALIVKAGIHMRTKAYLAAITALTQLLELNPTNNSALMNRGRAYHETGRLAEARRDDIAAIKGANNAFPAYFDLAEMADQETNRAAAISNYQLFLKYAPTNLDEIVVAKTRLKALTGQNP